MKKTQIYIISLILIMIISFLIGFVISKQISKKEINEYKKIIEFYFPTQEEIFSISAKIIEIQNNNLIIETRIQDPYILPTEQEIKTIKIIITNKTKIFNKETEQEISISDLQVNNRITVESSENIKDKNEFEAKIINIFP